MKKNTFMRLAAVLLVLTLLSTSVIGGTFAKYVSETKTDDSARVAKWGFGDDAVIEFEDLFDDSDPNVLDGNDDTQNIIAPGTTGSVEFAFVNDGTPEVAYKIVVDTDGSAIADAINQNTNIIWSFDNVPCTDWADLLDKIEALSQDDVEANKLPDAFEVGEKHTVSWEWKIDDGSSEKDNFDNDQNETDTAMGNAAVEGDLTVTLKVKITATQID